MVGCNRSKPLRHELMHRDFNQSSDHVVDTRPVSAPIQESGSTSDYPWFDPDDDSDDLNEPEELDLDDPHWDAFLADDDELDPQPAPGDFWPADD
jgi:hypothetical protein